MSNERFRQLLIELKSELNKGDIDAETRARLAELEDDIERVLGTDDDTDTTPIAERARELEAAFEARHPVAGRVTREIIDLLGRMGI